MSHVSSMLALTCTPVSPGLDSRARKLDTTRMFMFIHGGKALLDLKR